MNKAKIGGLPSNTHVLMMQVVDAANPSRTHGSPVPVSPEDTGLLAGIGEGKAVLLTLGPAMPAKPSSGLGRVGKQEPGTQHPGILAQHREGQQNSDPPADAEQARAGSGYGSEAATAPSSRAKKRR